MASYYQLYLDVTPPVITCPYVHRKYADRFTNSTSVFWRMPTCSDNSGKIFTMQPFSGNLRNGSSFEVGRHEMGYMVNDSSGNMANCSFEVIVDGKFSILRFSFIWLLGSIILKTNLTNKQPSQFLRNELQLDMLTQLILIVEYNCSNV